MLHLVPPGLLYQAQVSQMVLLSPTAFTAVLTETSDLTSSLVRSYDFDEVSGVRIDQAGQYDLEESAATVNSRDVIGGNGADFSGITPYLRNTPVGEMQGNVFTVCAWVTADSFSGSYNMITSYNQISNGSITSAGWWLARFSNGRFGIGYANGSSFQEHTPADFANPVTGNTYLVAAHIDLDNGTIGISVNGEPWAEVATTQAARNTSDLFQFTVGYYKNGAVYPWDGGIAGVRYWDRKLSAAELNRLYNTGNGLLHSELIPSLGATLNWVDENNNPNEQGYEIQVSYDNEVTWETVTITAADVETYFHEIIQGPANPVGDTFILNVQAAPSSPTGGTYTLN